MSEIRKDSPGIGEVHVPATGSKPAVGHARKPRDKAGVEITKSAAEPLYVYRQLLNADEVVTWAKAQGFATTIPAGDMHVTITYSRAPVDWMAMGESWSGDEKGHVTVTPGGPRQLARFGPENDVAVLLFACDTFAWRNTVMREKGASWDWEGYEPHVSISWQIGDLDLSAIEPYQGKLVFGPEIFETPKTDWKDSLVEKKVSSFFKVSGVTDLGLVFGWGIVCTNNGKPYVDVHKNHIPEDAMVEATTEFMKSARVHGDMHDRGTTPEVAAGMVVHSFPLTAEIAKAMGITCAKTGWMVATAPDPAMLAKFRSGEYTGFSIGGEHIEIDGKPVAEAA